MANTLSTLGDVQRLLDSKEPPPTVLRHLQATVQELIRREQELNRDNAFSSLSQNLACAESMALILVDVCLYCEAHGWNADRIIDRAYQHVRRQQQKTHSVA